MVTGRLADHGFIGIGIGVGIVGISVILFIYQNYMVLLYDWSIQVTAK